MGRFCQGTKQSPKRKDYELPEDRDSAVRPRTFAGWSESHFANEKSISLTPIGTYASGIFDAGGAEIVAHDARTQRLFVVNAQAATVDVLSIRDPSQPEKIGRDRCYVLWSGGQQRGSSRGGDCGCRRKCRQDKTRVWWCFLTGT